MSKSGAEQAPPYGTRETGQRTSGAPVRRVRTHHLREMKQRGEKFAMLTSYDTYTAQVSTRPASTSCSSGTRRPTPSTATPLRCR